MKLASSSMWRSPLLLLLLLGRVFSPTSAQQGSYNEYILYSLKPFSLQVTSSFVGDLNLATLELTIKAVSELFIKQEVDAALLHSDGSAPIVGDVEGVSLQVAVKQSSQRHRHLQQKEKRGITAEMVGGVAFQHLTSLPSREVAEAYLENILEQAFQPPSLGIYQERLQATNEPHLQQMTSMIVTLDFENQQKKNVGNSNTPTEKKKTFKTTFLTLVGILICGFAAVLFVRVRAQKKRFHEAHHHHRHDDEEEDTSDFYGSHPHNLACMAEQGNVMHRVSIQRQLNSREEQGPHDEYDYKEEQPSLLSKFYQRAFSGSFSTHDTHSTTTTTTIERHAIHNPRMYDVRMNDNDEDVVDHHIHRSGPYIEQECGTLASWVKSTLSKPFSFSNTQPSQEEEEEELQFMHESSTGKPFVYRDFPRHDGTPCLIYNSPLVREQQQRKSLTNASTVWASTTTTNSNGGSFEQQQHEEEEEEEEPVDSFVDRLEQLMVVRHEQYQERCNLEYKKRRNSSTTPSIMSIEQAEAALDDFLDLKETSNAPQLVSPNNDNNDNVHSTPPPKSTLSLQNENCLTDEKNLDAAMRAQQQQHYHGAQVSWDEQDDNVDGGIMS